MREVIEEDLDIVDNTAADLQDEVIAPFINSEYSEQVTNRMEVGGFMNNLAEYTGSVFQNFASYLRTEVDLVEDDIRLVLDKYSSSFITYELETGIYTFRDNSEVLFNILQSEYPGPSNVFDIDFDDTTRKINWL